MPAWLVAGPGGEPGTVEPSTVHGVSLLNLARYSGLTLAVVSRS